MAVLKITAEVYVEVASSADPEGVAATMHSGLQGALASFPAGEVIYARVEEIAPVTDRELAEHGLAGD
jgi:hypothetical protein